MGADFGVLTCIMEHRMQISLQTRLRFPIGCSIDFTDLSMVFPLHGAGHSKALFRLSSNVKNPERHHICNAGTYNVKLVISNINGD